MSSRTGSPDGPQTMCSWHSLGRLCLAPTQGGIHDRPSSNMDALLAKPISKHMGHSRASRANVHFCGCARGVG